MNPVTVDEKRNVVWAQNQPEYLPLPSVILSDGTVITKWKMTLKERIGALIFGVVYHEQLTFGYPLQPIRMGTKMPEGLK